MGVLGMAIAVMGLMMAMAVGTALGGEEGVVVVAPFDADQQELPEGLSIDKRGNMYVTLGNPFFWAPGDGEIRKISPDGTETELAFFPEGQGPAGIVVNPRGDVYFAWPNPFNPDTNGVYRLNDDGTVARLPGSEKIVMANGLAFDKHGDLFVSDSAMGIIWHIPTEGSGPAEEWADSTLLGGCGDPSDVGANGVAFWKDSMYVANTSRGLLVRVPILKDGSAGTAEIAAGDDTNGCVPDDLFGMDGIALDVDGTVYALLVLQNKLVRIDPSDGSFDVLLTEDDGLHNPASIAFGTGRGDRKSVFMTNYAVIPPEPATSPGPAILKLDVGVPGLPLP